MKRNILSSVFPLLVLSCAVLAQAPVPALPRSTAKEGLQQLAERAAIIAQGTVIEVVKRADPLVSERQPVTGRVRQVADIVFLLTDIEKGGLKAGDKVTFMRQVQQENNSTINTLGQSAKWFQPGQHFLLFLVAADDSLRNKAAPPLDSIRYDPLVVPVSFESTDFGVLEIIDGRAATNARLETPDQRRPLSEILADLSRYLKRSAPAGKNPGPTGNTQR